MKKDSFPYPYPSSRWIWVWLLVFLLNAFLFINISSSENISKAIKEARGKIIYHILNGNYELAEKLCYDFIKYHPERTEGYIYLMKIFLIRGEYSKVENIINIAVKRVKDKTPVYFTAGKFYYDNTDYYKAISFFTKITQTDKFKHQYYEEVNLKNTFLYLGKSYYFLKNYTKAEEIFKKLLSIDLHIEEVYDYLSIICNARRNKDCARAYEELKNLILAYPEIEKKEYFFKAGIIFIKNKQPVEACKMFEKIDTLYPKARDFYFYYNYGLANLLRGNYPDAITQLEKSLMIYKSETKYSKFLARLLKTDCKGARIYLLLAVSTYKAGLKERSKYYYNKIKKMCKSLFHRYPYSQIMEESSRLYIEIWNFWMNKD